VHFSAYPVHGMVILIGSLLQPRINNEVHDRLKIEVLMLIESKTHDNYIIIRLVTEYQTGI
jgi:hypothetical protein